MAVLVAAVWLSAFVMRRANPATRAWNVGEAQIVFVGTSHAIDDIVPPSFHRPVGVVTFPGLDHRLADAVMARHQSRWPRLSTAVLEVDEFTLLTDMTYTNRDTPLQLLARLDLSLGDLPRSVPDRTWRARQWLAGRGSAILDPSLRFTAKRLFFSPAPAREQRQLTASAGALRVAYLRGIAAGQPNANIDALVRMSRRFAAHGVRVALMSYPQHADYRAERPAEWDAIMTQAVSAVRAAIGNVEYWDYRRDATFGDGDFANVDHLNAAGAAKLSELLDARLAGLASVVNMPYSQPRATHAGG